MDRRDFLKSFAGTVASYALFRTLFTSDALAGTIRPVTDSWVKDLHEMSADLKSQGIAPHIWQEKIDRLLDRVELREILAAIDFDKLTRGFEYPDLGVSTKPVRFPSLEGLPETLAFYSKVFGMKKNRAIIPHGHRNMVSNHYVLRGDFHLRHYEKVEDGESHMIIEPTIDQLVRPGSHSSISDEKNNIHWLKATTESAFTFDVLVVDLAGKSWEVDNIDPYGAEKIAGGRLRVRKLGLEEALQKYGNDMHH